MVKSVSSDMSSQSDAPARSPKMLAATYEIISMIRQYGLPDEKTAELYAEKIGVFYVLKKRLFSFFNLAVSPKIDQ